MVAASGTAYNTSVPSFGHSPFAQPHSRFGHGENVMRNAIAILLLTDKGSSARE